jgi:hypothetical protein
MPSYELTVTNEATWSDEELTLVKEKSREVLTEINQALDFDASEAEITNTVEAHITVMQALSVRESALLSTLLDAQLDALNQLVAEGAFSDEEEEVESDAAVEAA